MSVYFRNLSLHKFMLRIIYCMSIFTLSIFAYILADTDSLLYLASLNSNMKGSNSRFNVTSDGDSLENGAMYTVSNGSGLNLLLISKLNSSYIKEMLTIYKECEDGSLNSNTYHTPIEALIGMQVNETGFYKGTQIPASYLPQESNKIIWNEPYKGLSADQMTLSKFGDAEWNHLGGGLCSWLKEGVDSDKDRTAWCIQGDINVKSKYNKGDRIDQHLLGNIVSHVDSRLTNMVKGMNIPDDIVTRGVMCSLASMAHNRGESGAKTMSIGITYSLAGDSHFNKYVDYSKVTDDDKKLIYAVLPKEWDKYMEKSGKDADLMKVTSSEYHRWAAIAIAAHSDGWFFSNNVLNRYSNVAKDAWNVLYPNDKVSNKEEWVSKIKPKVMDLKDAIKQVTGVSVTSTDTSNVYGTSTDYDDGPYISGRAFGVMYKVHDKRSSAYKHKYSDGSEPFLVSAFDNVTAGHNYAATVLGSYIYGNLLKLGGLDGVDPTNPDTYMQTIVTTIVNGASDNTQKGQEALAKGLDSIYKQKKVPIDMSKMTQTRVKILNAAAYEYGYTGYLWGEYGRKGRTPTSKPGESGIDCSTFVSLCYTKAGLPFGNVNAMTDGVNNAAVLTTEQLISDKQFFDIPFEEMRPGDILVTVTSGHTGLFLGGTRKEPWITQSGGAGRGATSIIFKPDKIGVKIGIDHEFGNTKGGNLTGGRNYKSRRMYKLEELDKKELKTFIPSN